MSIAFTQGPWAIFPYVQQPGTFTIIDASKAKRRVAKVDDSYDGISRAEAHANARLIAAAPELHAWLECALNEREGNHGRLRDGSPHWSVHARAVLAKVRGEEAATCR